MKDLACAVLVMAYVSAFFIPCLVSGTTTLLPSYQDESQWLLYHAFIKESYARGAFPLWTPDLFCGMPFLAWSHSAALYPFSALFAVLDYNLATWVNQWAHALIWSGGLFFLCRKAGAGRWAAVLGVLTGGALFVQSSLGNFLPDIRTGAWTPWLFFFGLGLVKDRRLGFLAGFIAASLMMYLGGQVELIGLAWEIMAVTAIGAGLWFIREWRRVLISYLVFSAAFALCWLVSQVQALPTLELTSMSIRRAGLAYEYFKIWSSPDSLNVWLPYLMTGAALVPLAAALAGVRRSCAAALGLLALLFCAALMHDLFGVMWLLHRVPVLKGLLAHARVLNHMRVVAAVMIALGADRMMASNKRSGWLLAVVLVSWMAAGAWWAVVPGRINELANAVEPTMRQNFIEFLRAGGAAALGQAVIGATFLVPALRHKAWFVKAALAFMVLSAYACPLLLMIPQNKGDVFGFPRAYQEFMEDHKGAHRTQSVYAWDRWERIGIPLQTGVLHGTRSADGFITVSLDRYTRFMNAVIPGTFREKEGKILDLEATRVMKEGDFITNMNIPWLNFLGMKYIVAELRNIKFADHFFLAYPDSPFLAAGDSVSVMRSLGRGGDARDLLMFRGKASARVHAQEGDVLAFQSPGKGEWLQALVKDNDGSGLAFSVFSDKGWMYAAPLETGEALIELSSLRLKGPPRQTWIEDPVIMNPQKHFERAEGSTSRFSIFHNPSASPIASLAASAIPVEKEEALDVMTAPGFDPATRAVAERLPGKLPQPPVAPAEGARLVSLAPMRLEVRTNAATPRLLVLAEAYFPGWRAWVDGVEAPILPADYAFRGVVVDRGRHAVRMEYRPASFRVGLFATLASLVFLAAALLAGLILGPERRQALPQRRLA